jgi:hypothetical protein
MRRRAEEFDAAPPGIQLVIRRRMLMRHDKLVKKSIESPDEIHDFPRGSGSVRVVTLGDQSLSYMQFKPGWRWSKDVGEVAGTPSCPLDHYIYFVSGRMAVKMDDGSQIEVGPGDVAHIPPGHDAWTLGNVACVALDWTGASSGAKPR